MTRINDAGSRNVHGGNSQPVHITNDDLNALINNILVRLNTSEEHIGQVGGSSLLVPGSFTRPNDVAQYSSGDAITNSTSAPLPITFNNCARIQGGSGVIVGAVIVDSAVQSTALVGELWLFDTTFTADNDNTAFTPTDAECITNIGIIPIATSYIGDATAGAGGNRIYISSNFNIPFKCNAGSRALFGGFVARNAYTPVALETFVIRLRILQD